MYAIGTTDKGSMRVYYHTATNYYKGGELLGDILEARKFNTLKEVGEWILNDPYAHSYDLGFIVVHIADYTIEKMKKDIENNDYELYSKFHDPAYVS